MPDLSVKVDLSLYKDKQVRAWVRENALDDRGAFAHIIRYIEYHREETENAALQQGDTEFVKGEVSGIDWVLQLIHSLATDTETETAQADTGNGNGSGE